LRDSGAAGAYPVASTAYVFIHVDPRHGGMSRTQVDAIKRVLDYLLGDGQAVARELSFAPLPERLRAAAAAAVAQVRCAE
jgi:ABC-type phosphate transport system substrate-binding protein